MNVSLRLDRWSAYLPDRLWGSQSSTEQLARGHLLAQEEALDVSFLPPLQRRRLSRLSRLSLRLAHSVSPGFKGYCVFGSQHGELVTTQGLLESIVSGDIVSPAGFSASVHNTAVGLHSIHNKNTFPCTSISAGLDTLAMCMVEADALLQSGETEQVLLVCADDSVPQELAGYVDINDIRGFAALLKPLNSDEGDVIVLESGESDADAESTDAIQSLVAILTKMADPSVMPGELGNWKWRK